MRVMSIVVVAALAAGPVLAKPALRDVAAIDDALLDLGIADQIRKNCPDIGARLFKAIGFVRDLEVKAKSLGYSEAEIEAYTDSDAEKTRMKKRGAAYFRAKGVAPGDTQSYCALGRSEIEKSSRIGSLLRMK